VPRSRAPAGAAVAFGVAVALLVVLVGPLLLFNPWFTSVLQARHGVAAELGVSQRTVDRVTGEILADLYVGGSFDAALDPGEPLLDDGERSHMRDVSRLVRLLVAVALVAAIVAVVAGVALRAEAGRRGRVLLVVGGLVGTAALLVALTFAVAFDEAFLVFHELFFPPGTYLFAEGSKLITLFPEPFWFEAALTAGATILAAAALVAAVGLRAWRAGAASPERP